MTQFFEIASTTAPSPRVPEWREFARVPAPFFAHNCSKAGKRNPVLFRHVAFPDRHLKRRRGYLAFFPIGERHGDFGLAVACFVRDPHGAMKNVFSATVAKSQLDRDRTLCRSPVRELKLRNGVNAARESLVVDRCEGALALPHGAYRDP